MPHTHHFFTFQRCAVCQILLVVPLHPAGTLCARSQIARKGLANVKRRCRREREKSSRATSQQVTAGSYKHWSDETAPSICLRPFVIAQPKGKQKITKGLWRQPWNHPQVEVPRGATKRRRRRDISHPKLKVDGPRPRKMLLYFRYQGYF